MPEVRINTSFGDIRINYNNTEELNAALEGLQEQMSLISQAVEKVTPRPQRLPKPGYENAYRFLPNGKVEILLFPSALVQVAVLALFAYHPDVVTADELEQVTAIDDIVAKVVGQTKNKKYFRKMNNTYGLNKEGLDFFMEKVKPFIEASSEDGQGPEGDGQ